MAGIRGRGVDLPGQEPPLFGGTTGFVGQGNVMFWQEPEVLGSPLTTT